MSAIRILRTDSFIGGLNLRADPFQLGDTESPDLLNVDIDPRGGFAQRGGMTRLNTSAVGAIAAGAFTPKRLWVWESSSPQVLLAANSKVFYATTTSFTDTTIATTAAHGASFASWSGAASVVYVACGNGSVVNKWDGATKTALTASATAAWQDSYASPTGVHAPKADHIASHVDRMWVANTVENGTSFPNRVRFSHVGYPESWREVDYIDIVEGGSGITALVSYGGVLYVFKRKSITAIYGIDTETFQRATVTDALGAPSPRAVEVNERGVLFFSWPDGVFRLNEDGIIDLSEQIQPLIALNQVTETAVTSIDVSWIARRLWVSIPQGVDTTATYTYVFDPSLGKRGAWTKYEVAGGGGVAAGCNYVTSTGTHFPLACHPTEPYVLKVDQPTVYQDDVSGTPTDFTSYYVTKWHDAGNISSRKMWRRPDLVVDQPSVDTLLSCTAYHNWEESAAKRLFTILVEGGATGLVWRATDVEDDGLPGWGQANWSAGSSGAQFERGSNIGLARSVQLKIAGPGGLPWGVNSISYKYNPRKVRG